MAVIKAGDNQTDVTFSVPYDSVPKIAEPWKVCPTSCTGVATKTPTGFTIARSASPLLRIRLLTG